MAKAPVIPESVKRVIAEAALAIPRKRREAVVSELEREIADMGSRVPQHQTLLKMVSDYRSKGQTELDTPWSLGSLAKFELPPDTLGDVLEAWKWSLAIGHPLTNREALWFVRLRSTLPIDSEGKRHIGDWIGSLHSWAQIYSLRERATEALGIPNDTGDLDAELVSMGAWEWHTAILVGAIAPSSLRWEDNRRIFDKEATFDRDTRHYSHMIGGLPHEYIESELGGFHAWWVNPRPHFGGTAYENLYASLEESTVYAYWLRHLSKGPLWDSIPFERQNQIKVRLREEVQAVAAATRQYREAAEKRAIYDQGGTTKNWGDVVQVYPSPGYSIGPEPGPVPSVPTMPPDGSLPTIPTEEEYFKYRPPFFAWQPKDLLKVVGYFVRAQRPTLKERARLRLLQQEIEQRFGEVQIPEYASLKALVDETIQNVEAMEKVMNRERFAANEAERAKLLDEADPLFARHHALMEDITPVEAKLEEEERARREHEHGDIPDADIASNIEQEENEEDNNGEAQA